MLSLSFKKLSFGPNDQNSKSKKSWKFEIFYDLLCSRNDFSRVKINKWQGEACFELKRVEAPLAKSSIVRSFALIQNKRFSVSF